MPLQRLPTIFGVFCCVCIMGSETSQNPEVWLHSYAAPGPSAKAAISTNATAELRTSPIYKDKYISKNVSDYILQRGTVATFICQAPYPVEWTTPNATQLHNVRTILTFVTTQSERDSELTSGAEEQPQTKQFKTYLNLPQVINFFNVGFTCKATSATGSDSQQQSSIHVYILGTFPLENMGGAIYLPLATSAGVDRKTPIILPCRPANPIMPVVLERLSGSEWKPVPSEYYSFDPKYGFTFPLKPLPDDTPLPGTYRCSVKGTDSSKVAMASVLINVTSSKSSPEDEKLALPHSALQGKAKIVVEDNFLKCCSGVLSIRPKVHAVNCRLGPFQCDILKRSPLSTFMKFPGAPALSQTAALESKEESDCTRVSQSSFLPGLLRCNGENVDYLGDFAMTFHPEAENITWRNYRRQAMKNNSQAVLYLTEYKDVGNQRNIGVKEKMLIIVGHNASVIAQRKPLQFSGSPQGTSPSVAGTLRRSQIKMEHILEYGRNVYYEGESLRFMCLGLTYFHGFGAHLRLNWKNGTKTILKEEKGGLLRKVYFYGGSTFKVFDKMPTTLVQYGREVTADLGMESVDCFMPHITGANWDKLNYPVKVLPAIPPKIAGDAEETVQLGATDKNVTAECTVVEGLPRPRVTVLKEGKAVLLHIPYRDDRNETDFKVNLHWKVGISGKARTVTYQCIAENVKGRAVKTFKIVVKGTADGEAEAKA